MMVHVVSRHWDPASDPTMALASLDVAGPALARPRLLCWSGNSSCCGLQHKACFSANAKPIREATTATCVLFETESLRMISRTWTFTVDSGRFSARPIILFGSPRHTPSRTDCCRPLSSRRGKDEDKAVFAADAGSLSISSPSTSWITVCLTIAFQRLFFGKGRVCNSTPGHVGAAL